MISLTNMFATAGARSSSDSSAQGTPGYRLSGLDAAPMMADRDRGTDRIRSGAIAGGALAIGMLSGLSAFAPSPAPSLPYAQTFNRTAAPPSPAPAMTRGMDLAQSLQATLRENRLNGTTAPVRTFNTMAAGRALQDVRQVLDAQRPEPRATPLSTGFAAATIPTPPAAGTYFPSYTQAVEPFSAAPPAPVDYASPRTTAGLLGAAQLVHGALNDDMRGAIVIPPQQLTSLRSLTASLGATFDRMSQRGVSIGLGDALAWASRKPQELTVAKTGPVLRPDFGMA